VEEPLLKHHKCEGSCVKDQVENCESSAHECFVVNLRLGQLTPPCDDEKSRFERKT